MTRDERRREKLERKLARRAAKQHIPLHIELPVDGLSGAELDAQLRKRAERRMAQRSELYKSLVAFVVINVIAWAIWAVHTPEAPLWPLVITAVMTLAVIAQAIRVYQDSTVAVGRREQQIQRAIEIEKMRLGLTSDPYEKPKRDQAVRLSDDGELVSDEDVQQPARAKHS